MPTRLRLSLVVSVSSALLACESDSKSDVAFEVVPRGEMDARGGTPGPPPSPDLGDTTPEVSRPTDAVAADFSRPGDGGAGDANGDGGPPPGPEAGAADAFAVPAPDALVPPPGAFWRIDHRHQQPEGAERTWVVSPEGQRTFLLGVNTVMRDVSCDGIAQNWIRRAPPTETANAEWARLSDGESGGRVVENPYCFNHIGGFSETNDFDDTGGDSYMIRPAEAGGAGAPYTVVVYVRPGGDDRALKDENGTVLRGGYSESRVGDPYNPAFLADMQAIAAAKAAPRRDDPRLIFYFINNEDGMFDRADPSRDGVRDFRRWLWSDCPAGSSVAAPLCAPHALAQFLQTRYGDLQALNVAWESDYAGDDFALIVEGPDRPVPYVHDCNQTCREDLQRFTHEGLVGRWIEVVTTTMRAADPNHLISSPRLALANANSYRFFTPASEAGSDVFADAQDVQVPTDAGDVYYRPYRLFRRVGASGFDLVSINVYSGEDRFDNPWFADGLHRIMNDSGLPIYVSETSVRARIDGWSNRGGSPAFVPSGDGTDDQIQRGAYYRSKVEQLIGFRDVIGLSWHAWTDRYLSADATHQINMGLMKCDDPARGFQAGERWDEIDDRMAEINCNIDARVAEITGQ